MGANPRSPNPFASIRGQISTQAPLFRVFRVFRGPHSGCGGAVPRSSREMLEAECFAASPPSLRCPLPHPDRHQPLPSSFVIQRPRSEAALRNALRSEASLRTEGVLLRWATGLPPSMRSTASLPRTCRSEIAGCCRRHPFGRPRIRAYRIGFAAPPPSVRSPPPRPDRHQPLHSSFVIRHSSFVICPPLRGKPAPFTP